MLEEAEGSELAVSDPMGGESCGKVLIIQFLSRRINPQDKNVFSLPLRIIRQRSATDKPLEFPIIR